MLWVSSNHGYESETKEHYDQNQFSRRQPEFGLAIPLDYQGSAISNNVKIEEDGENSCFESYRWA